MLIRNLIFKSQASFKRQLIGFFFVSAAILAITTSFITSWQTSQEVRKSTIETGMQVTSNFAAQSVLSLLTDSEENAQEAVQRALGFQSVSAVAILNKNGELLTSLAKSSNKAISLDYAEISDSTQLLDEKNNWWIFSSPVVFVDDEDDTDTVEPEERLNQQILGYVLIEYNKSGLHRIQRSIFTNNFVIGLLVTVLLALLMRWGINRLTSPLSILSKTMESARDLNFFPRAEVKGAFEIREMAKTYNQMMSHLEQQNSQLEKHRDNLESEVEIRTLELKAARDTALTASRHKSEFLANISHELRTPLQAIIGYSDLVKEELEFECMDPQVEDLNKSIRAAHNLLELINNILDIAKIEAGRMDLYLKVVDMELLISDTIETIQPMATANNNELIIKQGKLSESLTLDRQKVKQILLNLLSNACKFTKNGQITLEIYNDQNNLYFSVEDTGVGIPEEQLDYIFEEFTQVDGSQTRQFEGTGLGMAITKTFCNLMDGQIKVESELGSWTKFSVVIPLQNEE